MKEIWKEILGFEGLYKAIQRVAELYQQKVGGKDVSEEEMDAAYAAMKEKLIELLKEAV